MPKKIDYREIARYFGVKPELVKNMKSSRVVLEDVNNKAINIIAKYAHKT